MKKTLFLTTFLFVLSSLCATGQTAFAKVKTHHTAAQSATKFEAKQVSLISVVAAYYKAASDSKTKDNYYIVLADTRDASYNDAEGRIEAINSNVVMLDLYVPQGSEGRLPTGEFMADGSSSASQLVYAPDYSEVIYYDAEGKASNHVPSIEGVVNIAHNINEGYIISFTDSDGTIYNFKGNITFTNMNGGTAIYPQISSDINTSFTGGMAFYHGNLMKSNTGNIYINLYDCNFDPETGAMKEKGYNLAICAFNRLFGDPKKATVLPGVYTVARNFNKETYFPGMEIDYNGITVIMGTYVKQRKAMSGTNTDYAYGYITEGTITITKGDKENTFNLDIACTTDRGHKVHGTAHNVTFTYVDKSDDKKKAVISNLNDDITLDLSYIKTARAYYLGLQNGVNVLSVDIGSPSGKDGNEGDLFKMEFQTDPNVSDLVPGTYELMEQNHLWTNLYAPYKMTQGYFDKWGELIGTRYWHFAKGRYQVVDTFAAVTSGRISVEEIENNNYKFTIDVTDGNGFLIKGTWSGPIEKNYEPTSIMRITDKQGSGIHFEGNILVLEKEQKDNATTRIFTADGRIALVSIGSRRIDVSRLGKGFYIIKTGDKNITKFAIK